MVSTHSRPKAAAYSLLPNKTNSPWFQHTAARRRLHGSWNPTKGAIIVSTHSRPKAAACLFIGNLTADPVSTHSRPKAAAIGAIWCILTDTGFNTQPPEGGCTQGGQIAIVGKGFQHTAARRRLPMLLKKSHTIALFQHTAARRRLHGNATTNTIITVSTHSRPKAAANGVKTFDQVKRGFNTQPPEGGCLNQIRLFLA
mgnify:CR=1 FL=1